MDYKTYLPGKETETFLKCFWSLEAEAEPEPEKQVIVPDGCMELIFHYGDLYRQYTGDDTFIMQPRCFVFGQITVPLIIAPSGVSGIFAARFHPDGFMPFATQPPDAMANRAVPLDELFGEAGTRLGERVVAAATTEERIQLTETFLLEHLQTPEAADRIAKSGLETILHLKGQLTVGELSEKIQVNRRQLERRFSSVIGLSPKQLAKMIRLQTTLKMLENKQVSSLTALAYEGGYFDQAHFIKDFKEFTGMSPKQFFAGNLRMSALFIAAE